MKASGETIKMKTPEGEVKVAVLSDSPGTEEFLQHLNAFLRMLQRKKYKDDLQKLAKAVGVATALVRKIQEFRTERKAPRWPNNSSWSRPRKQSYEEQRSARAPRWGSSMNFFARA